MMMRWMRLCDGSGSWALWMALCGGLGWCEGARSGEG